MNEYAMQRQTVQSHDGATISYITYPFRPRIRAGSPNDLSKVEQLPGLIILHGGLKSSQTHTYLAESLCDLCPVYLPDRRGRGSSSQHGTGYCMKTEIEDLRALLLKTRAKFVLGVSGGANVALAATIALTDASNGFLGLIEKTIIFEPHLVFDDRNAWNRDRKRFEEQIDAGKIGVALTTALKMSKVGSLPMRVTPKWILGPLADKAAQKDRNSKDEYSMWTLAPTLKYDFQLIMEMDSILEESKVLQDRPVDLLMIRTGKSASYLRRSVEELESRIPKAEHLVFTEYDHSLMDNKDTGRISGSLAPELKRFLTEKERQNSLVAVRVESIIAD